MTPAEFETTCEAALEDLALFYAHFPAEGVEQSLDRMLRRIEAGWLMTFKDFGTPEEVAEIVAVAVSRMKDRVLTRRREIEAGGAGTA